MNNLSLICKAGELSRQLRVTSWKAGLIQLTIAQIKELFQPDGKDLPVGQRFEYGDVNTCWTCQDKGEESN
jgi:hypothetical protein